MTNFSQDALRGLSDQELLKYLADSHDPELLQPEIRRRMQLRADRELRAEQHAEISRMVEHLEQTTVDWQKVRDFFRETLIEVQESWRNENPEKPDQP